MKAQHGEPTTEELAFRPKSTSASISPISAIDGGSSAFGSILSSCRPHRILRIDLGEMLIAIERKRGT